MNGKTTYNKIVIKPLPEDEVTRGGIILPPSFEKKQFVMGTVVAVGPGRVTENGTLIPCCVSVGDKILYSRHTGIPMEIDGEKYTITSDVEAVFVFKSETAGA